MASKAAQASKGFKLSEVAEIAASNPGGEGRFFELDILRGFVLTTRLGRQRQGQDAQHKTT